MKVFIFGKNGMLGNYIFNYLIKHSYYVVPITREDFDAFVITYNKMDMILKA